MTSKREMKERMIYVSKRDNSWSMAKYQRFLKENRGTGELAGYKPWLCIQDFPSKGRASRIKGWKTNRIHHFFSDLQTRYFYMFEWNDEVLDIREHYPLLDLPEVVKNNEDLKQDYFNKQDPPYVLTTIFLLTLKDKQQIAIEVKLSADLQKKSVLERLEIQRRYWEAKGVNWWGVMTQKEIPTVTVKNIEWIHQSLDTYEERGLTREKLQHYSEVMINKFSTCNHSIRKVTSDFDKENDIEVGTGLYIFKYLLASKRIRVNMNEPIDIAKSNPDISIIEWGERYASNQ